jgi:hypothetical protein
MRDISKWFEARSCEQDSAGIRKHLNALLQRLTSGRTTRPDEDGDLPTRVETVPNPEHLDKPTNSL